jgi:hypothetical protein
MAADDNSCRKGEAKMPTEPVRPPLVAENGVESRSAESRENDEAGGGWLIQRGNP